MARKRRGQERARAAALPAPGGPVAGQARLSGLLPSGQSLLVGFALLALGAGAYAGARETSIFAVRRIEVVGARGSLAAQVRRAVRGFAGRSLIGLDGSGLLRGVESVPAVASATFDRAFPHTLRIVVQSEQAVAVLRRGPDSWLVSARGRILGHVRPRTLGALPRIWIRRTKPAEIGTTLPDDGGGAAARALAPLVHTSFAARVATATLAGGELDFTLRSGVEVRLGHPVDLRLKFAVARRLIAELPAGARYLDVSVPERPVAGIEPQLSG